MQLQFYVQVKSLFWKRHRMTTELPVPQSSVSTSYHKWPKCKIWQIGAKKFRRLWSGPWLIHSRVVWDPVDLLGALLLEQIHTTQRKLKSNVNVDTLKCIAAEFWALKHRYRHTPSLTVLKLRWECERANEWSPTVARRSRLGTAFRQPRNCLPARIIPAVVWADILGSRVTSRAYRYTLTTGYNSSVQLK